MTFAEHLGANHEDRVSAGESIDQLWYRSFAGHRITVDSNHWVSRKAFSQERLRLLCANTRAD